MALRQGVVWPTIWPRRVPRRFSLAFVVRTLTAHDGHVLLLVELLDGGLDLDLVGVVVDGEGVLAAAGLVDRLLADDRAQDDLGGGQGAHAYTSCIRARAGCSMSDDVGLEQVDDVERVGQDDLDRRQVAGRQLELLVARRGDDEDAGRCASSARERRRRGRLVRIASSPNVSMTLIASSPNLAVSAPRSARRFILRGRRCS